MVAGQLHTCVGPPINQCHPTACSAGTLLCKVMELHDSRRFSGHAGKFLHGQTAECWLTHRSPTIQFTARRYPVL